MSELPRYTRDSSTDLEFLPKGFHELPTIIMSSHIMTVVRHMKLTIISYEDWLAKAPIAPELEPLKFAAVTCAHNIHSTSMDLYPATSLSVSDSDEASVESTDLDTLECVLYATIRWSCLIFTGQFFWPLPRASGVHLRLSILLTECLENLSLLGGWAKYPDLVLWSAIMGALVGLGSVRSRFLQTSRTCLDLLNRDSGRFLITKDTSLSPSERTWEQVLSVCRTFLMYEGMESSLAINLAQVKREALELWDEPGMLPEYSHSYT